MAQSHEEGVGEDAHQLLLLPLKTGNRRQGAKLADKVAAIRVTEGSSHSPLPNM